MEEDVKEDDSVASTGEKVSDFVVYIVRYRTSLKGDKVSKLLVASHKQKVARHLIQC